MPSICDRTDQKISGKKTLLRSFGEEFLDTERLRDIHYGNLVLRHDAHLFVGKGVVVALAILIFFWLGAAGWPQIAALTGLPAAAKPAIERYEVLTSVTLLSPSPAIPSTAPPKPSAIPRSAPDPSHFGKILAVREAEAPPAQSVATQSELKQAALSQGTLSAPGSVHAAASGSGATSGSADDVPMNILCDKMPGFLERKKPLYPETARIRGMTGKVFVSVLVSEEGQPIRAKVTKRIPPDGDVFDAVAIKAMMESKFYPGIKNGKPIKVWFTVPMRFELD